MVDYSIGSQESGNAPADAGEASEYTAALSGGTLPYISKSRVKQYINCPKSFYYNYILGIKPAENFYMKRGTRVHKAIEMFYRNAADYVEEHGEIPTAEGLEDLLPYDRLDLWLDHIHPFIYNFLVFEAERVEHSIENEVDPMDWVPVSVEEEGNLENPPVEGSPRWMGYSDIAYLARSIPDKYVPENHGVVIVDVKTGKTPDPKYREKGIYMELEFYTALFEEKYDIAAVAGLFPKQGDFLVSYPSDKRRAFICDTVADMLSATRTGEWPLNEQPLCKWREGKENQCDYYEMCSTRWGRGIGPTYDE